MLWELVTNFIIKVVLVESASIKTKPERREMPTLCGTHLAVGDVVQAAGVGPGGEAVRCAAKGAARTRYVRSSLSTQRPVNKA